MQGNTESVSGDSYRNRHEALHYKHLPLLVKTILKLEMCSCKMASEEKGDTAKPTPFERKGLVWGWDHSCITRGGS